jgi:sugar (pentulose or hexulose) kinase
MNRLSGAVPPGADGLVLLPFFAGAFAPENDLNAKGVLYGLTLKHSKAHVARAIQESVGYMLRKILAVVTEADIRVVEVRSMGGAARSDLWMQIKADICNLPLVRMQQEETSTLGCAILAAVVGGEYRNAEEAVDNMVRVGQRFSPSTENVDLYSQRFRLYNELYQALAPVYKTYAEGGPE